MSEFKKFILKGNIIDMAVGVIIGGAFSKIVTSLVNDILMPALGAVTGGASFSDYKLVSHPAVLDEAQNVTRRNQRFFTEALFRTSLIF